MPRKKRVKSKSVNKKRRRPKHVSLDDLRKGFRASVKPQRKLMGFKTKSRKRSKKISKNLLKNLGFII